MLPLTGRRALGGLWARAAAACNSHAAGLATQPALAAAQEHGTVHEAPPSPFTWAGRPEDGSGAADLDATVMATLQRHFLGAAPEAGQEEPAGEEAVHEEAPPPEGSAMAAGMAAYAARQERQRAVAKPKPKPKPPAHATPKTSEVEAAAALAPFRQLAEEHGADPDRLVWGLRALGPAGWRAMTVAAVAPAAEGAPSLGEAEEVEAEVASSSSSDEEEGSSSSSSSSDDDDDDEEGIEEQHRRTSLGLQQQQQQPAANQPPPPQTQQQAAGSQRAAPQPGGSLLAAQAAAAWTAALAAGGVPGVQAWALAGRAPALLTAGEEELAALPDLLGALLAVLGGSREAVAEVVEQAPGVLMLSGVELSRRLELLLLHLPLGAAGEGLPGLLRRAPALLTVPEARLQGNVRTLLALCASLPAFEAVAARHPRLLTGAGLASRLKALEGLLQTALFPPPPAPAKGKAGAAARTAAIAAKAAAAKAAKPAGGADGRAAPNREAAPGHVVSGVAAAVVRAHPLVLTVSLANQRWAVEVLLRVAELSPEWREELQGMAAAAAEAAAALNVVLTRPEDSRYLREEAAAAAADEAKGAAAAPAPQAPPAGVAAARDPSAAVAALGKLLCAPPPALLRLWYLAERDPSLAEEESMAAVVGLSPDAAEELLPGCGAWVAAELGERRRAWGEERQLGQAHGGQPAAEVQVSSNQLL